MSIGFETQKYLETEEHRANVSWGAIFAGAVSALAVQGLFMTLGAGIGFSAFNPAHGDSIGTGSFVRAGIFTAVTGLISLFVGGYVAGRLAGFRLRTVSALHGMCAWATVSVFVMGIVISGIGSATSATVGAIGSAAGEAAKGAASTVGSLAGGADISTIVAEAKKTLRQTGKAELDPDRLAREGKSLPRQAAKAQADEAGNGGGEVIGDKVAEKAQALDRDALANVVAKRMNITKAEAQSLITQAETGVNQVGESARQGIENLKQKGIEAAQQGTKVAAGVSWSAFFSLLLGAMAAIAGGLFGGPSGIRDRTASVSETLPLRRAG